MKSYTKFIFIVFSLILLEPAFAQKNMSHTEIHAAIEKVSINKATAETLSVVMKGIGMKKAQAIVDYRKHNGPFKKVEDLVLVKGIGVATVEKNKQRLTL